MTTGRMKVLVLSLLALASLAEAFVPFPSTPAAPVVQPGVMGGGARSVSLYAKKKGKGSGGSAGKMGSQPPLGGESAMVPAEEAEAPPAMEKSSVVDDYLDEDSDDEEDEYDPEFLEQQKRLREGIDFDRPYSREKPRNWDFITGLPVPLKIKLNKVFPFADPQTRKRYRQPFPNDYEYMAERIKETFTNQADKEELRKWYIANRDWLGQHMRLILAAKSLKFVYLNRMDEAQKWHDAFQTYRLVESSVTCHLQQVMREAEARLSGNLGNMDMISVAGRNRAERSAMWLMLKSVLAKWEDRRERYLSLGEERTLVQDRALSGTRKVVELFQKMNLAFSECQPVMQSLPVEIQYLDTALTIRSGTEIRRWTIKEFCPQNGLTVEQLRERVRALYRILEDLLHEEMAVLHDKILDIYRAIALGTAEFETEDPYDIIFRTLPPSVQDMNAPLPFKLEPRLDAAGAVNRTVASTTADKLDIFLKKAGVPFPESTKERLQPRQEGDDLWFDRWALLWGRKPEDWYALKNVAVSQQLAGTFDQDFIDRMQRQITRRRKGAGGGVENPIYTFQYEFIEKPEEEKAAFEEWLVAQRANKTMDVTYFDVDGKTILTEQEVQDKYLSDPTWRPPPLPHPRVWLNMIKERNAKIKEKRAAEQRVQAVAAAAEALKEAEDVLLQQPTGGGGVKA